MSDPGTIGTKKQELTRIMEKFIYETDLQFPNKSAILEMLEQSYKLGLHHGWALEQEEKARIKEPL